MQHADKIGVVEWSRRAVFHAEALFTASSEQGFRLEAGASAPYDNINLGGCLFTVFLICINIVMLVSKGCRVQFSAMLAVFRWGVECKIAYVRRFMCIFNSHGSAKLFRSQPQQCCQSRCVALGR